MALACGARQKTAPAPLFRFVSSMSAILIPKITPMPEPEPEFVPESETEPEPEFVPEPEPAQRALPKNGIATGGR